MERSSLVGGRYQAPTRKPPRSLCTISHSLSASSDLCTSVTSAAIEHAAYTATPPWRTPGFLSHLATSVYPSMGTSPIETSRNVSVKHKICGLRGASRMRAETLAEEDKRPCTFTCHRASSASCKTAMCSSVLACRSVTKVLSRCLSWQEEPCEDPAALMQIFLILDLSSSAGGLDVGLRPPVACQTPDLSCVVQL